MVFALAPESTFFKQSSQNTFSLEALKRWIKKANFLEGSGEQFFPMIQTIFDQGTIDQQMTLLNIILAIEYEEGLKTHVKEFLTTMAKENVYVVDLLGRMLCIGGGIVQADTILTIKHATQISLFDLMKTIALSYPAKIQSIEALLKPLLNSTDHRYAEGANMLLSRIQNPSQDGMAFLLGYASSALQKSA